MVLGVVAIVIGVWALIPFVGVFAALTGFFPAIIAVILGHIGMVRSRQMHDTGRGQAMAGLVTGYITLGIILLTTAFWIIAVFGAATASTGGNA